MFSAVWAKEPTNLEIHKQELIQYYDSGQYEKDINAVMDRAMSYIKTRVATNKDKKLAIILDIDETSLSNYPHLVDMKFGGSLEQITQAEHESSDPAIPATLKLFQFAKANKVSVFFLSGRHEDSRSFTEFNLQKAGYANWDGLILRTPSDYSLKAPAFKTAARKKLTEQGYTIIGNIGDQQSDLTGGYADKTFKLPNPFYLIP